MRFYFQDEGQKVATKCIRVSSTATTNAVIQTLIEKFRPDMRMLTIPEYALYEIHENGGMAISQQTMICNTLRLSASHLSDKVKSLAREVLTCYRS